MPRPFYYAFFPQLTERNDGGDDGDDQQNRQHDKIRCSLKTIFKKHKNVIQRMQYGIGQYGFNKQTENACGCNITNPFADNDTFKLSGCHADAL